MFSIYESSIEKSSESFLCSFNLKIPIQFSLKIIWKFIFTSFENSLSFLVLKSVLTLTILYVHCWPVECQSQTDVILCRQHWLLEPNQMFVYNLHML